MIWMCDVSCFHQNLDFGMQTLVTRLILVCNWNALLRLQNGLSTWFWTAWSIAVYCEAQIPRPDISFATCHHPAASCWQPSATLPSALAPLRSLSLCSTAPFCNLYKKYCFLRPRTWTSLDDTFIQTHTEHRCFLLYQWVNEIVMVAIDNR